MDLGCFACERTLPDLEAESARRWRPPRPACPAHAAGARLEDGTALAKLLEPAWPEGLDGAGANLLLNPWRVEQWRAWLDVTSRGRAVLEEVFPSADYFDFAALHLPTFVEVLYALRDHAPLADREPLGVMAALGADNTRYTALQALLGLWTSESRLRAMMAREDLAPPTSLDEAAAIWRHARASGALSDPDPDRLRLFLIALLRLAGRRFGHLRPSTFA